MYLPHLSRVEAFQSALLATVVSPVMRFEYTGIDKSDVGIAGDLVDRDESAKPEKHDTQDGHEDSETNAYQSDFEVEIFQSMPFCVAEACHYCQSVTYNNDTVKR
jgi:hypothetical protein